MLIKIFNEWNFAVFLISDIDNNLTILGNMNEFYNGFISR